MLQQEPAGPVERGGALVEHGVKGLEHVRHPRSDIEGDAHVSGGGSLGEADGVVEEHLVGSGLDDEGWQAGQVGEKWG